MKRVVVTGLGAVTPVGNDVPTTWAALLSGRHGIAPITRFDTKDYKATLAAELKDFDPLQYMDRSEVRRTDPHLHYAVAAAAQAVKESGIEGAIAPERFGCYFSSGISGITTMGTEEDIVTSKGPRRVSPYTITNMMSNASAGTVAIHFNCKGSCMGIVSACASSTHAIGEAMRTIRHGYADAILAGGTEATITPLGVAGFINCQALSTSDNPDRASIPFDLERKGFIMGEGAAALVLEEYEHAKARGAHIYCEVCGYGSSCDAHHITAPDPTGDGAARAIREAMAEAGMQTDKIYLNAHGTGTPLNDKGETLAIKLALGEELAHKILVSSTKSMTGHMLGAAGAVEAIASILALQDGVVPPTVGYQVADPECDLDIVPNVKREARLELALSNSLGFGGHNGCLAFRKAD